MTTAPPRPNAGKPQSHDAHSGGTRHNGRPEPPNVLQVSKIKIGLLPVDVSLSITIRFHVLIDGNSNMFDFFKKKHQSAPPPDGAPAPAKEKKSIYQRFQDAKTRDISNDEVLKYTGKTKDEIREWGKDRPNVAGNQAAGKLDMGGTSGLGGMATAEGYGGWGPNANAPLKYPPKTDKVASKKGIQHDSDWTDADCCGCLP